MYFNPVYDAENDFLDMKPLILVKNRKYTKPNDACVTMPLLAAAIIAG